MTIGLALTIIFLVLRYGVHAIDWPLWVCFLPVIVELAIELLLWLAFGGALLAAFRSVFGRSSR